VWLVLSATFDVGRQNWQHAVTSADSMPAAAATVVLGCNALSHSEEHISAMQVRQPSATAAAADDH
jgi:hypothetical protein